MQREKTAPDHLNWLLRFGQTQEQIPVFFKTGLGNLPWDIKEIYEENTGVGIEPRDAEVILAEARIEKEIITALHEGVVGAVEKLKGVLSDPYERDDMGRYGADVKINTSFLIRDGSIQATFALFSYSKYKKNDFVEIGRLAVFRELQGRDLGKLKACGGCGQLFFAYHGKRDHCSTKCTQDAAEGKKREKPGFKAYNALKTRKSNFIKAHPGKNTKYCHKKIAEKWLEDCEKKGVCADVDMIFRTIIRLLPEAVF